MTPEGVSAAWATPTDRGFGVLLQDFSSLLTESDSAAQLRFAEIIAATGSLEERFEVDVPPLPGGLMPHAAFAVAPTGEWAVGLPDTGYRIALYTATGSLLRTIERKILRVAMTEERVAARRDLLRQLGRPRTDDDRFEQHFNLGSLRFNHAGELWVRTERGRPHGRTVLDAFDSSAGALIGSVEVAPAFHYESMGWDIRGRRLLALVETEHGIVLQAWDIECRDGRGTAGLCAE